MAACEEQVKKLISKYTGVPVKEIMLCHSLLHDLKIGGDDAAELIEEYSSAFSVDVTSLEFDRHFPPEPTLANLFNSFARKGTYKTKIPITVEDLVIGVSEKRLIGRQSKT
jgi:hypothetical protein